MTKLHNAAKRYIASIVVINCLASFSLTHGINEIIAISKGIQVKDLAIAYFIRKILLISIIIPIAHIVDKYKYRHIIFGVLLIKSALLILRFHSTKYGFLFSILFSSALSQFKAVNFNGKLYQILHQHKKLSLYQKYLQYFFFYKNLTAAAGIFLGFYFFTNNKGNVVLYTQITINIIIFAIACLRTQDPVASSKNKLTLITDAKSALQCIKDQPQAIASLLFLGIIFFMNFPAARSMRMLLSYHSNNTLCVQSFYTMHSVFLGLGSIISLAAKQRFTVHLAARAATINIFIAAAALFIPVNIVMPTPIGSLPLACLPLIVQALLFTSVEISRSEVFFKINKQVSASNKIFAIAIAVNYIIDLFYLLTSMALLLLNISQINIIRCFWSLLAFIALLLNKFMSLSSHKATKK